MKTKLTTAGTCALGLSLILLCWLVLFAPSAAVAQNHTLSIYAGNSDQQPVPVPTGTVNVQPGDNFCASSTPPCRFSYPGGTTYTGRTLTLTMDRDQLVQAVFTQNLRPPAVNIISPTNNTAVWACTLVRLVATATAPSGWISSIEFFLDTTNGTRFATKSLSTSPATALATWWIDAVGVTDTFVVRATDNNGAQTVSSPITVTTTSPPLFYLLDGITNNQCELCMSSMVGRAYSVLATTNFTAWTNIGSMTGTNTGFLTFVDPAFTNLPYRFYRAEAQTNQ